MSLEIGEVWVNWAEGAEYGYQVYYPFEWKEEDELERCTLVPAIKVTPGFFDYLENGVNELPDALFSSLEQEKNPFCFIASDGTRSLVIDTLGYQIPIRKSRLLFEQEQSILRYLKYEETQHYEFYPQEENETLFALLPKHMIGLTRAEREKKQLLLEAVYGLKNEKKAKILYYYIEFAPTSYKKAKSLKKATLYQQFVIQLKEGWCEQHEHVLQLFLNENQELRLLYDVRV